MCVCITPTFDDEMNKHGCHISIGLHCCCLAVLFLCGSFSPDLCVWVSKLEYQIPVTLAGDLCWCWLTKQEFGLAAVALLGCVDYLTVWWWRNWSRLFCSSQEQNFVNLKWHVLTSCPNTVQGWKLFMGFLQFVLLLFHLHLVFIKYWKVDAAVCGSLSPCFSSGAWEWQQNDSRLSPCGTC